jgi:membrane-associated protease RseP (regulator of RpoE activity)
MLEEMIAFQKETEKLLKDNPAGADWRKEAEFFQTKLLHLQIERLIHLLVTMTVGLATLISCYVTMINRMLPLIILDGILIILFFAYILHYRKLENTAQSWYATLDKLKKKVPG